LLDRIVVVHLTARGEVSLKQTISLLIIIMLFPMFTGMLPQVYAFSESYMSLSVDKDTKVFSKPSIKSKVISQIIPEESYPVMRSSKFYHYISLPDGTKGWVRKRFSNTETVWFQTQAHLTAAVVKSESAAIYAGPGNRHEHIETLRKNQEFPIVEESKYYYKLRLLDRKWGWVSKLKVSLVQNDRIVMGWNYLGGTNAFIKQARAAHSLDIVTPRWFRLTGEEPYIETTVDLQYAQWAHESGRQVWAMLGNKFDTALTNEVLSDEIKRTRLAENVAGEVLKAGIDGINLDFENMDIKNKDQFVDLVAQIKRLLAPHGKKVSVDVTRHNPDPFWSGCYDRAALGKAADYVVMMGYDEHWGGGGKAGSVASLPWVEEGLRLLMKEVPAHKILLGVPFYIKEWITDEAGVVTARDLSMPETEKLISDRGLPRAWDEKAQQYYVEYTEAGKKHQIWVEDEASMRKRWEMAVSNGLAGAAAWAIGMETGNIWDVFDEQNE
jgi:spore germination protein